MKHRALRFLSGWVLVLCLAMVSLIGCGLESKGGMADPKPSSPNDAATAPKGTMTRSAGSSSRLIARAVFVKLVVDDPERARRDIRRRTLTLGGWVENEFSEHSDGDETGSMTLQIPSMSVDSFLAELSSMARHVERREDIARDVTAECVDLDARLRIKKAAEERYLSILSRAQTVPDVLAVEKELRAVREEIESAESQQRKLQGEVAMSTVRIGLGPPGVGQDSSTGFFGRLGRGLAGGVDLGLSMLIGLAWSWPVWMVLLLLVYGFLRLLRKRRARKERQSESARKTEK